MCSGIGGVVEGAVVGGGVVVPAAPGEEENFEEMDESHELRREMPGEEGLEPLFNVVVLSVELLREKLGRCGMGFGAVVARGVVLCGDVESFSVGESGGFVVRGKCSTCLY